MRTHVSFEMLFIDLNEYFDFDDCKIFDCKQKQKQCEHTETVFNTCAVNFNKPFLHHEIVEKLGRFVFSNI